MGWCQDEPHEGPPGHLAEEHGLGAGEGQVPGPEVLHQVSRCRGGDKNNAARDLQV